MSEGNPSLINWMEPIFLETSQSFDDIVNIGFREDG